MAVIKPSFRRLLRTLLVLFAGKIDLLLAGNRIDPWPIQTLPRKNLRRQLAKANVGDDSVGRVGF